MRDEVDKNSYGVRSRLGVFLVLTAFGLSVSGARLATASGENEGGRVSHDSAAAASAGPSVERYFKGSREGIESPGWLAERAAKQKRRIGLTSVMHDFSFEDRREQSGINFRNHVVPDGGKHVKAVHYDHGNGIVAADVDGDGFLDLYFTSHLGGNELWRNLGNGTFENITEKAGVAAGGKITISAAFADIDNDGDPDLYVTTVRSGNSLFENQGGGSFKDITAHSGLGYEGHSSGAVFFDYDNDGRLDLFLTNVGRYTIDKRRPANGNYPQLQFDDEYSYYVGRKGAFQAHLEPKLSERNILFRNIGSNKFVDVTDVVGPLGEGWSGDATALDRNEDGWPDLYVTNMQGHDEYYENLGGEKFVDKSREVFPATSWGAMGIKVFDYNNDGRMDIYVTDMHTDMGKFAGMTQREALVTAHKMKRSTYLTEEELGTDGNHVLGNSFFRNDGNGEFTEVSDQINVENFWPWGLSVGDLNSDGYQDIFVTASMNMWFDYAPNNLLLNDRGRTYLDSEFVLGVEPRRNGETAKPWYRFDCDEKDRSHAFCSDHQGGQHDFWEALGSRSSVVLDLDDDGDLDIVTNEWNWFPMVLVSDLSDRRAISYLKVGLSGTRSNRDGLGAKVTVYAAGQKYVQVQDGTSGYISHSIFPLYFGLGEGKKVDRIEIDWPSGTHQVITAPITINSLIEVVEK